MLLCGEHSSADRTLEIVMDPEHLDILAGQSCKLSCMLKNPLPPEYYVQWMVQKSDNVNWTIVYFRQIIKMNHVPHLINCTNQL